MFIYTKFLVLPILLMSVVDAAPVDAVSHLAEFGYLPPIDPNSPNSIVSDDALSNAIRTYQEFMGLPITGNLDGGTEEQMGKPRCGIQDQTSPNKNSPNNYELKGTRWTTNRLTYRITKYPRNLPREETDSAIRKAFDIWARVTPLTFVKKNRGRPLIEIRFEKGDHNEICKPFDGPHKVLAHAYFPSTSPIAGDAHFDDTESWTLNSASGTNLLQVLVHEFGHALGIRHSKIKQSVMYPTHPGYQPNLKLHRDDIDAIQVLYPNKVPRHSTIRHTESEEDSGSHEFDRYD